MPQWLFDGSFSYKFGANPDPQYEIFVNGNQDFAAKLFCVNPGVGFITFHRIIPYQEGLNDTDPRTRVADHIVEPPPHPNIFRLYRNNRALNQLIPVNPIPFRGSHAYEIMWIHDYLITLHQQGHLRLTQQHQSARHIFR